MISKAHPTSHLKTAMLLCYPPGQARAQQWPTQNEISGVCGSVFHIAWFGNFFCLIGLLTLWGFVVVYLFDFQSLWLGRAVFCLVLFIGVPPTQGRETENIKLSVLEGGDDPGGFEEGKT